jgi:flagellar assembly protein FliH
MTSPYEVGGVRREVGTMPIRLLPGGSGDVVVSRLEYEAIEMPRVLPRRVGMQSERSLEWHADQLAEYERHRTSVEHKTAAEFEAMLERGRAEGRVEAAAEADKRIAVERSRVLKTCEGFHRERESYFAGVEGEVVKLALAIAAQVLHREVKLDPMLLGGVVRVALGKVSEESGTVLRVPVQDAEAWQSLIAAEEFPGVTVVGDARTEVGECVLETSVGRVELGVSAQLEEIETGFYDLLQQRPL